MGGCFCGLMNSMNWSLQSLIASVPAAGLIAFMICPRPAARLSGHGLKSGTAPAKVISWSEPAETEPKLKDMGLTFPVLLQQRWSSYSVNKSQSISMWFKTRVGLVSVADPTEILMGQHAEDSSWSIYALFKVRPEVRTRGLFGVRKRTTTSQSSFLAMFSDRPGVGEAIGECMAKIEGAIKTQAHFCDLSQSGDAEAWGKRWQQVQWPRQNL